MKPNENVRAVLHKRDGLVLYSEGRAAWINCKHVQKPLNAC